MRKYNVVVVGSGPSGATAAYRCARRGLSTLLIEKKKLPREKPCGGAVSARAMKELGFNIDEVVQQIYHEARMYRPRGDFFLLDSGSPIAVGVLRKDFDSLLTQRAISEGVCFREEEIVEEAQCSISGIEIKCRSGFCAQGETLIAADGPSSDVARLTNIRKKWGLTDVALAFVWEKKIGRTALKELMIDGLEFYIGLTYAGYGWVFPKGDYVSVGAGTLMKELQHSKDMVSNLIQKVKKLRPLDLSNPKWHLVPIGGTKRRIGTGRVLLVGDAAGFVDPMSGEGIQYAIISGKIAAIAIERMLEDQKPEQSSNLYTKLCEQAFLGDLRFARWLATRLYYHPDLMLGLLLSDRKLSQTFAKVIRGEETYKSFVTYSLRRIPILFGEKLRRTFCSDTLEMTFKSHTESEVGP